MGMPPAPAAFGPRTLAGVRGGAPSGQIGEPGLRERRYRRDRAADGVGDVVVEAEGSETPPDDQRPLPRPVLVGSATWTWPAASSSKVELMSLPIRLGGAPCS